MASRLPVVISQHASRAGKESQWEEGLIAALIFANGLDATLVHGLESIAEGSTDHLCLEGLMGDFALLSWLPWEVMVEELNRLQIAGRLLPYTKLGFQNPVELAAKSPKKIRAICLQEGYSETQVMAILQDWLDAQSVRLVSLGGPKTRTESPSIQQIPSPKPAPAPAPSPPSASKKQETPPTPPASVPPSPKGASIEEDWAHLDKLVDDLDAAF